MTPNKYLSRVCNGAKTGETQSAHLYLERGSGDLTLRCNSDQITKLGNEDKGKMEMKSAVKSIQPEGSEWPLRSRNQKDGKKKQNELGMET